MNYYPKKIIIDYCEREPETVRSMFRNLFNESKPLFPRVEEFMDPAEQYVQKYSDGTWKMHYQDLHAISVYLAFENPGKYYIYKRKLFKQFAAKVGYENVPKSGKNESLEAYYQMCDEVHSYIMNDTELLSMSRQRLDNNCYADLEYRMLTMDIVFFGHNYNGMFYNRESLSNFYICEE